MADTPLREARVKEGIDKFCQWLNEVNAAVDPTYDYTYKPADFVDRKVLAEYNDGWHDVIAIWISDRDEGGPNVLTLLFTEYMPDDPSYTNPLDLRHATQMFDTMLSQWMSEGQFINTGGYYTPPTDLEHPMVPGFGDRV